MLGNARRDIREEIHVIETGGATAQHLGNSQFRAGLHEFFVNPAGFSRPDVVLQPVHQGDVISESPEQAHGCMRMCVDQPGNQGMVFVFQLNGGLVLLPSFTAGQNLDNTLLMNSDAVVLQAGISFSNGKDPAGVQQGVNIFHWAKIPADPLRCKRL